MVPLPSGTKLPFGPLYRMSPHEIKALKQQVADLLQKGLITPDTASFGAPCLFATKKNSAELRLVVDYRKLNALIVPNRGTLPRIDDAYTTVRGAQVFSAIDLTAGYHQVRLPEEDVPKTSFPTPLGLFQFKVLPFGLRNAPQTFQAMMNEILSPLNEFCLVYMDDILVFSKTSADHVGHVRVVLERLRSNRLYAKTKKCYWGKSRLRFLGHVLPDKGLEVDPAKVAAVADWPNPENVSHVRSFLGLSNCFQSFIQGYSSLVGPLIDLTKKGADWAWTAACQGSFEGVKAALTSAPELAQPCFDGNAPGFEVHSRLSAH